jgi:hypothetical protein
VLRQPIRRIRVVAVAQLAAAINANLHALHPTIQQVNKAIANRKVEDIAARHDQCSMEAGGDVTTVVVVGGETQVREPESAPKIGIYWYDMVAVVVGSVAPSLAPAIKPPVASPLLSMEMS